MTASATTEEQQHSSSPSPRPPSPSRLPNLLLLPSTPLLSSRQSPSPTGPQSSPQENRRRPMMASREIAVAAAASAEAGSVNSNCAVTVTTSTSSCPATEISSSVINTPSTSETTALVVRHSSCDSEAPQALI